MNQQIELENMESMCYPNKAHYFTMEEIPATSGWSLKIF